MYILKPLASINCIESIYVYKFCLYSLRKKYDNSICAEFKPTFVKLSEQTLAIVSLYYAHTYIMNIFT